MSDLIGGRQIKNTVADVGLNLSDFRTFNGTILKPFAVTCSLYTHVFVRPFFVDLYLFSGAILSLSGTTSELEVQPSRTLALIGHAVRGAQSHT